MSRIDDLENPDVLSTGASTGIGAALARASNELSGCITGNIVHVNGGLYMP